jgi:TM2 domain-containing membrane protein YozV
MANNPAPGDDFREKNPSLAAFLAIFPGMGAIYNGNVLKGITFMLIFAVLIVLTSNAYSADSAVFGLMIAGFYIYQIIDGYNEACQLNKGGRTAEEKARGGEDLSLFSAVVVLAIGVLFQLVNFGLLSFRQVTRLWPLALIAFGIKIVFNYYKREETNHGKQ